MGEYILRAALAGLLHDVGKFAQRAGEGTTRIWDGEAEGDYRYVHALHSADFVAGFVPPQWRDGLSGPAMHHRPRSLQDRVVALADRLSAGERSDAVEHQPRRLLSLFCRVGADGQEAPMQRYMPLRPLAMEEEVVFATHRDEGEGAHPVYKVLWDAFASEAGRLRDAHSVPEADLETYVASMLMLLQRYTWCIPSAYYRTVPDVSLYDHSRMTAALAACLAGRDEMEIEGMLDAEPAQVGAEVALLVGGDISGVQDFIYTLSSRGATSALRGRSFYLQLLTEAVYRYVLGRLGLPISNLIYGGGGHFYLLAPPSAEAELPEIQRYVSRTLLQHHGGDLYLALGKAVLRRGDFQGEALSRVWSAVTGELRQAKGRRFSELGDEMHHLVFEPWRDQGNQELECAVCHHEHPGTRQVDDTRKCPPCEHFEDLGEALRQANVLLLDEIPLPQPGERGGDEPGTWENVLAAFGFSARLSDQVQQPRGTVRTVATALRESTLAHLTPGPTVATGRRFLVNVTPEQGGRTRTFEEMAEDAEGVPRLGVLRMDVDNLGRLFSQGLGSQATLSRVASLSFLVSLFFEGWVEVLAERHNRAGGAKSDRVYSIYSGGDDLFFVGSWDAMPDLALEIRDSFARFVAGHPGLHLSAGIALIGAKYPLYQAAADAGDAERQAKEHPGKNAVTFLGQTLDWDTFRQAAEWEGKLRAMCVEVGVPRALLRTLVVLQQQHDDKARERAKEGEDRTLDDRPQAYYGPWNWRAAYVLRRLEERHRSAAREIGELRELLSHEHFTSIRWIGLAARWAELKLRKGE